MGVLDDPITKMIKKICDQEPQMFELENTDLTNDGSRRISNLSQIIRQAKGIGYDRRQERYEQSSRTYRECEEARQAKAASARRKVQEAEMKRKAHSTYQRFLTEKQEVICQLMIVIINSLTPKKLNDHFTNHDNEDYHFSVPFISFFGYHPYLAEGRLYLHSYDSEVIPMIQELHGITIHPGPWYTEGMNIIFSASLGISTGLFLCVAIVSQATLPWATTVGFVSLLPAIIALMTPGFKRRYYISHK